MKRLAALALVVVTVAAVRGLGTGTLEAHGAALAIGFALVAAVVAGDLVRHVGLPRLTGYLLFGLLCGPSVANLITRPMARELLLLGGIAIALIAFIAGLELNGDRLRRQLAGVMWVSVVTVNVVFAGLLAAYWLVWPWLPFVPEATGWLRLALAAVVATVTVSFSPIVSIAVIADSRARGPLSELVLATTVIADLLLVLAFAASMEGARWAAEARAGGGILLQLAWAMAGSMAFGALVGAAFTIYLRVVRQELTLALLAVCVLLSEVGRLLDFEPILAGLTAGFLVSNVARPEGDALRVAIARGSLPVFVVFFATAGASVDLSALASVGLLALGVSALRAVLLVAGTRSGVRLAGLEPWAARSWTGLVSQAGITLGFASIVSLEFPEWGPQVQALAVTLVALHEVAGPVLFRGALKQAGEIGPRARRPLVVVSNREPYVHTFTPDGAIHCPPTAGGVAVALDALMRERGGVWIAHGAGSADRAVVDERDHVRVPPDHPSYTLRRIWIDEPTFSRYYGGFANEGLWPLCHVVDVRPVFRSEDWEAYQAVNDRFAAAIDSEVTGASTPVFIQDYHLALVAPKLRARQADARTAIFWHIPWPSPDRLRVCPWRREVVAGLLANDLIAFQVERDRRNFLMAVQDELAGELEENATVVRYRNRRTTVVSVPIGVDYDRIQRLGADPGLSDEHRRLVAEFGLTAPLLGVGVDRLDYTKGIPERLAALDRLLSRRPDLRGRLTFVQVGVPSRSELESYSAIELEIDQRVREINDRHRVDGAPPPVFYYKQALNIRSLVALYRMARFCVVSSLHDGMNLVAKEFVASRDDLAGVLVLSELAGAAHELGRALIINPYDVDGFAAAIARAIDMPPEEQAERMSALRRVVAGRDVFGWASDILEGLDSLWSRPLLYSSSVSAAEGPGVPD